MAGEFNRGPSCFFSPPGKASCFSPPLLPFLSPQVLYLKQYFQKKKLI
jgi:hypothetical protein